MYTDKQLSLSTFGTKQRDKTVTKCDKSQSVLLFDIAQMLKR